jgi:membrane fusion protein, multidrug efflux system
MKRKFLWMVLITQALAIIVLVFRPTLFFSESLSTVAETSKSVSPKEAAEPKEKEDSERPTSMTLQMHISLAAQKASDIRVERLSVAEASFETAAWGVVLPTSGLTEARMKLDQVQQELTQMSLLVDRAQQEFDRQSTLWRDGANVAKKTVDQAKHDLDEAEQKRKAARSARETLRDTVRAEWGNDVLNALEDGKGGGLASVLSGQSRLLLIAEGHSVEATVALAEHPEVKMKALRLGPAPQAEPGTGHATWFWLAPAEQLRTGQRVRLISGSIKQAGKVRIPESAVVWQAGQSWIFIQTDTEQFERKAVRLGLPVPGGWQLEGEIPVGTAVVTQGAQLLLSEESRTQIRNENGD